MYIVCGAEVVQLILSVVNQAATGGKLGALSLKVTKVWIPAVQGAPQAGHIFEASDIDTLLVKKA